MELKAVVTIRASSATMHDPIEASTNTQNFLVFSFSSGIAISSWLRFICPCGEDEPRWQKDSVEEIFLCPRILSRIQNVFRRVSIEIAANGACYETDRGAL